VPNPTMLLFATVRRSRGEGRVRMGSDIAPRRPRTTRDIFHSIRVRHFDDAQEMGDLSVIGVMFSDTGADGDARPTPALVGCLADGGVEHCRRRIVGHSLRALPSEVREPTTRCGLAIPGARQMLAYGAPV
jgi:hypothetical protein